MASRKQQEGQPVSCNLTLEDEFVLTRIRFRAHSLSSQERDQYLWETVFKLICRERPYKTILSEVGVAVDTNMNLFDDTEIVPED